MKKYNYHYLVNNKEVTKDEFLNELNIVLVRCDTNYDNPFLNISYTDTAAVRRHFNYMKTHNHYTELYVSYNKSFAIRREKIK